MKARLTAALLALAIVCALCSCAKKAEPIPLAVDTPPATATPSETPTAAEPTLLPTAAPDVPLVYTTLDATPTALAVLDDGDIAELIASIELTDLPATQGFYYSALSTEDEKHCVYSYLEIGGVRYDLGMVMYGESGIEWYSFKMITGAVDATETQVFSQPRAYGATAVVSSYYTISDGVPMHITDIDGYIELRDFDADGYIEILASVYGTPATGIIYKFDIVNNAVRQADLAALLGCGYVIYHDEQQVFITYDENIKAGPEYILMNGAFIQK